MSFQKGSQVIYAELDDQVSTKRFVLPNNEITVRKLVALLKDYPSVELVRASAGIITSDPDRQISGIHELESIPAKVDYMVEIQMDGHPEVTNALGRVSEQFIKLVEEKEVEQSDQNPSEVQAPDAQGAVQNVGGAVEGQTLTEKLRAQIAAQAIGGTVEAEASDVRSGAQGETLPASVGSADGQTQVDLTSQLRQQIAERKSAGPSLAPDFERETAPPPAGVYNGDKPWPLDRPTDLRRGRGATGSTSAATGMSKPRSGKGKGKATEGEIPFDQFVRAMLFKLNRDMNYMRGIMDLKTYGIMSGPDLKVWFLHSVKQIGFDATFDLLAELIPEDLTWQNVGEGVDIDAELAALEKEQAKAQVDEAHAHDAADQLKV